MSAVPEDSSVWVCPRPAGRLRRWSVFRGTGGRWTNRVAAPRLHRGNARGPTGPELSPPGRPARGAVPREATSPEPMRDGSRDTLPQCPHTGCWIPV